MNLNEKPPIADNLIDANKTIKRLWRLARELSNTKKSNSKNSSLPPSKDSSSKNKSNIKRDQQRKKNPKKQGGQPGHQKHERQLLPVEQIDQVVHCSPASRCACGGIVIMNTAIKHRHQQYELPVIKPIVTEYQIRNGQCDTCCKMHTGQLPIGISWSMLGPRATAMTAHLSGTYRISKQNIVHLYQDIFNFQLSVGMVCKAEKSVSKALDIPVNQARHFIQSAKNVSLNADETGFKEKGKTMWAWIAITCQVAVFLIRRNRSKKVAQELLGNYFHGILCSDRYSAYQWIPSEQRQICWAHLERDFRKISERSGTSKEVGIELLKQTNILFHHWHNFKNHAIQRDELIRRVKPIKTFIESLLKRGTRSRYKKTSGTCRNILSLSSALWRFLDTDGVEPTNNLAEQMIRTLAIWRKTSFGTQSAAGTLYMERIMTVVATCKLQSKNILSYLTDTVKSYLTKNNPPSLLPEAQLRELGLVAA